MVAEPGQRTPPRGERASTVVDHLRGQIEAGIVRPGARLPSVRQIAQDWGISRFTAVEAYDRLVAAGWVEARRGSGFYARSPVPVARPAASGGMEALPDGPDPSWLLRAMLRTCEVSKAPGAGLVPASWLDPELAGKAFRAVAAKPTLALGYGDSQGALPLREALARKLTDIGIPAQPASIVTTLGATQALDLILRTLVGPGDTVLVDDPGFFFQFAQIAAHGARVVGVPWTGDGPDLAVLEERLLAYRPRIYITSAALHNPTGGALSPAKAFRLLKLTEAAGTRVIEDDVWGDFSLHPPPRLAALEGLERVIHIGSFTKTLTPGWRVGYMAAPADMVPQLVERKLLTGITTPQITERAVAAILSDGGYRHHIARLRDRVAKARARALKCLSGAGFVAVDPPGEGLFVWARGERDSQELASALWSEGILVAPGTLFSPAGAPSRFTRINVAAAESAQLMTALAAANRA